MLFAHCLRVSPRLADMHPSLLQRGLVTKRSRPGIPLSALIAGTVLAVVLVGLGWLQSRVGTTAEVAATAPPQVSYIPGADVPKPPASFSLVKSKTDGPGRDLYVWGTPAAFSAEGAQSLFDVYVEAMLFKGWTLQSTDDPADTSKWALSWRRDEHTAFIQLNRERLMVEICPPNFYC